MIKREKFNYAASADRTCEPFTVHGTRNQQNAPELILVNRSQSSRFFRWSFFIAFFIWFAISPLLPEIQESLGLSKQDIWNSSIAGVGGTILIRFILGPLCDKYGARVLFTLVLCGSAIPTGCTGLVQSAQGLIILRVFIGLAGGTFVMCEYWTSMMFTKEIVGTANALVAGWGNLGASVTQLVMGSFLFPLFASMFDDDAEKAWRMVCIVPAVIGFVSGLIVHFISDDSPKGNYWELKKNGSMENVSCGKSFVVASLDFNTWILFIQYAGCFGVELTMNNAAALYFRVRLLFDSISMGHPKLNIALFRHRTCLANLQNQPVPLHPSSDG